MSVKIYNNLELINIKEINYGKSVKEHKPEMLYKIETSIKKFGLIKPIILDKKDNIVAGHAVYKVCKKLLIEEVPCVRTNLSEKEGLMYSLIDNNSNAYGFRLPELSDLLNKLENEGLSLHLTGFEEEQIENLMRDNINIKEFYDTDYKKKKTSSLI